MPCFTTGHFNIKIKLLKNAIKNIIYYYITIFDFFSKKCNTRVK